MRTQQGKGRREKQRSLLQLRPFRALHSTLSQEVRESKPRIQTSTIPCLSTSIQGFNPPPISLAINIYFFSVFKTGNPPYYYYYYYSVLCQQKHNVNAISLVIPTFPSIVHISYLSNSKHLSTSYVHKTYVFNISTRHTATFIVNSLKTAGSVITHSISCRISIHDKFLF